MDKELKNSIITRMSDFQMRIKTLSIAVLTAGTFVDITSTIKMAVLLMILISLWILDAYYLTIERRIRNKDKENDLGSRELRDNECICNNLFAKSVIIFHFFFILAALLFLLNSIFTFVN